MSVWSIRDKENIIVHSRMNLRRTAALAAMAVVPAGLVGLATPATAATAQTASLHHGMLRVTGTPDVDLIGVVVVPPEVAVDFGLDGTVERRFALSRVTSIRIRTYGDNDAIHLTGTGEVPLSIATGQGSDFVSARGRGGVDGGSDAITTVRTQGGKDDVVSVTPGHIVIDTGGGPDSVEAGTAGVGTENVTLGGGDDSFSSAMDTSLGAREDVVDAGPGHNTMFLEGTTANESLALSAQYVHLLIAHDGGATINSLGFEQLFYDSNGGRHPGGRGDTVTVGDLTGAGLVNFTPNFSANIEQTQPNDNTDRLTVTGTNGVDNISVSGVERNISVDGLATQITPIWLTTPDALVIDTLRGKDQVDTSGLEDGLVQVRIR
jgi:hypothetical protein